MRVKTIPAFLRSHAVQKGNDIFCTFIAAGSSESVTFTQLLQRSQAYESEFRRRGISKGDLVVVILKHSTHLFYAYLGAILAGAVPTFMPFPSPKQRAELYWADHATLFERIKPHLIVTYRENLETAGAHLPGIAIPTLIADDAVLLQRDEPVETTEPHQDDIACLQHSSGTTNLKKGVMLSHRAIVDAVRSYSGAIGFGPGSIIASWLPLYHDMGFIACFMASVIEGSHLVALDPFEWTARPSLLLDAIEKFRAQFSWLPNFAFSHIVNATRPGKTWDLSSMRAFINCSEPCKAFTFDRFAERFASSGVTKDKLQICYAMAENVFAVTQTPIDEVVRIHEDAAHRDIPSCGFPISGVELRICDSSDIVLPDEEVGEIQVRSPFMFSGYYKLPEKTKERVRGGWYATGDLGFISRGELFVTGRTDDMIIINGRNYYSHEVEAAINEINGILPGRSVALGIEDARSDATVLVILAEAGDGAEIAALENLVRHQVAHALGLSVHAFVPLEKGQLVKTTSGKISRVKNKELYLNGGFQSRASAS